MAHISKVIYRPDTTVNDEFTIMVNHPVYKKWKDGDKSIPLTEVVDSFHVLFSNQGAQGILGTPSKQQLDNVFGTHKDTDVVQTILEKGKEQHTEGISGGGFSSSTNMSKGSMGLDTRGKGNTGI